jgi:hypothetical protein
MEELLSEIKSQIFVLVPGTQFLNLCMLCLLVASWKAATVGLG